MVVHIIFFSFTGNEIPTIVFSANIVTTLAPSSGQTLVFSSVLSNIGSGYDSSSGIFTAPVNGTYSFTVQLCVFNKNGQFSLVLDGNVVMALQGLRYNSYSYTNNYYTTSGTVPLFLKSSQTVWVRSQSCTTHCLQQSSACWNRFSGSLVHI